MCAVWRGLSQRVRSRPNGFGDGVFLSSGAVMVPLSEPSLLESSPARVTIEVCVAYIDRGFRIDPPRIVVGACVCVTLSVQTQVMQFFALSHNAYPADTKGSRMRSGASIACCPAPAFANACAPDLCNPGGCTVELAQDLFGAPLQQVCFVLVPLRSVLRIDRKAITSSCR